MIIAVTLRSTNTMVQAILCLQAFESETKSIWDPNDFRPGMGKKRLTMLYVIDSLCIGNSKSEQIPTETRQELVDTFSARLPSFVQRLSTPCNCDKVQSQHLFSSH